MSGALSKLFGGGSRPPAPVSTAVQVNKEPADIAKNELLKRLATLRRATMTSELTTPNVKRKTLGAGAVS